MKKIISTVLVCVLLVSCIFALASCAKTLNGTYRFGSDVLGATYEFSGNNVEVTYSVLGFSKSAEGTYKIAENEEGQQIITITFGDDADDSADEYAGEYVLVEGVEGDTKYIKLNGTQYNKVED